MQDPSDIRHGDGLSVTDPNLLSRPLDFIAQDHYRERTICSVLDQIALPDAPMPEVLDGVLNFLSLELPLHLADEECDLFPLMRRRCPPEDDINAVIKRLLSDHRHAERDTPTIQEILRTLRTEDRSATIVEAQLISDYATHARRHLIVENAIILPLARARLTAADIDTLRLCMRRRRGIEQNGTAPDA